MNKIEQIQKIVAEKQYGKVEGAMLDLFSASAIMTVYNNLGEEDRARFLSLPVAAMAELAFKLLEPLSRVATNGKLH